jgi:hypothetical protein
MLLQAMKALNISGNKIHFGWGLQALRKQSVSRMDSFSFVQLKNIYESRHHYIGTVSLNKGTVQSQPTEKNSKTQ